MVDGQSLLEGIAFSSVRQCVGVDELKDLYSAEHQILKALPKMATAASDAHLAKAFTDHLAQTKDQVTRLDKIFKKLDVSPRGKTCKAMEGLLEEGKEVLDEDADPTVKDAALIAAAQRVEHYEMAGYGCVRTFARLLGEDAAADLLQETLDEEGAADKKLTKLAETVIDVEAVAPAVGRQVVAATQPQGAVPMRSAHPARQDREREAGPLQSPLQRVGRLMLEQSIDARLFMKEQLPGKEGRLRESLFHVQADFFQGVACSISVQRPSARVGSDCRPDRNRSR